MPHFIIRVELHKAIWPDDYDNLHIAMKKQGFSHTVKSTKGIVYELPTAEYYSFSSLTIDEIIKRAEAAATTIGKKFGVLVSQCEEIRFEGLTEVKQ